MITLQELMIDCVQRGMSDEQTKGMCNHYGFSAEYHVIQSCRKFCEELDALECVDNRINVIQDIAKTCIMSNTDKRFCVFFVTYTEIGSFRDQLLKAIDEVPSWLKPKISTFTKNRIQIGHTDIRFMSDRAYLDAIRGLTFSRVYKHIAVDDSVNEWTRIHVNEVIKFR